MRSEVDRGVRGEVRGCMSAWLGHPTPAPGEREEVRGSAMGVLKTECIDNWVSARDHQDYLKLDYRNINCKM